MDALVGAPDTRDLSWLMRFAPCSDAVESVSSLYNHVEEQAHVLVQRTNLSLEHLEYLLQLREFEGHFMQVMQVSVQAKQ